MKSMPESMPEKSSQSREIIKTPEQKLVELLAGLSDSEEVKRIREAFVAGKEGKAEDLVRMTLQTKSPEMVRRLREAFAAGKEKVEERTTAKAEKGGAEEAARVRVVPEPVAPAAAGKGWEAKRRAGEIKPEERAEIFKTFKKESRGLNLGREITKEDIAALFRHLGSKRFWGTTLFEMASGAGVGFLARNIANSIGILTGGTGYLVSVPAGTVAGALAGGVTAWLRERHREISRDEIVEKARSAEGERKEKFDAYLKLVELAEVNPDSVEIREEQKRFYQELRKEFGTRKKQIVIGAAKGAFFGAVGGTVATWIFNQFGAGGGGRTAENLAEARKAAKAAGGEALRQQLEQAATSAPGIEYAKVVNAGLEGLDARDFTALTRKGEGATHLARKLLSDYISQHQALGDKKFSFSKAQLVYAEDWLQKYIFTNEGITPRLGESFKFKGEVIRDALVEARGLSPAEIENLNKNWVGKISEKTWGHILNYKNVYNAGNDFTAEIFGEAQRKSAAAGKRAAEELGRAAARPPSPAATAAAGSWFKASLWGLGLAGTGLAAAAAYRFREPLKRAGRDLTTAGKEFGKFAWEMKPSLPSLPPFRLPSFRKGEAAKPPEAAETKIKEPSPVVDIEAQRLAEEAAQREEAVRAEAARTETERVEHEKKLAADQLRTLLREGGVNVEPEDNFHYEIPSKESIAARKGPSMNFDNYPDFRQYLEGLTPEERVIAERFETTIGQGENEKKYPTIGIWASPSFWNKLKASPKLHERLTELEKKALKGLLADEYRGLPEKEDPEVAIMLLMEDLRRRFKATPFYFHRNPEIPAEEDVEALHKLSRVLERIPKQDLPDMRYGFMIGKRGIYNDRLLGKIIEVDPTLSEEEIRLYIIQAAEKLKSL